MDKPLIWAGSKLSLVETIRPLLPPTLATRKFMEPFAGSAAVTFALEPKRFLIADTNPWLINFYQQLAANGADVASWWGYDRVEHLALGRTYYMQRRAIDPTTLAPREAANWFLYLNRTCFNGLWRVNSGGGFNVPMGHLRNIDSLKLFYAGEFLRQGMVLNYGYDLTLDCAQAGDVVYLDPPYSPKSATANFSDYTKDGWTALDDQRLADRVADLTSRGVYVILSGRDDAVIRARYPEPMYRHVPVTARDSISATNKGRGASAEVLILNYLPAALTAAYSSLA